MGHTACSDAGNLLFSAPIIRQGGPRKRPLTIAFVYDALYPYVKGGGERRYFELAQRLRHRHSVHCISWQYWPGAALIESNGLILHGVGRPPSFYGRDGKRTVREAWAFALRLLTVLLKERFDVIDISATPYVPVYAGWIASRLTRTPLVVTWHEVWGDYWLQYLKHRPGVAQIARWTEAGCTALGDVDVAVSAFTEARLRKVLSPTRPLRLVENGISLDAIEESPAAECGADVVFLGRLIDDKKVEILLEALTLLRADFPCIRCDIIGDGPERLRLEELAQDWGLKPHVRFLGHLDERSMYGLVKAAKVFALPSVREGFGVAIVEAQACGLVPVVARASNSAAPLLVNNGVDGLVCDLQPEAFADAIAVLLGNEQRRSEMSRRARQAASNRDWDRIAERMEQVYYGARATSR